MRLEVTDEELNWIHEALLQRADHADAILALGLHVLALKLDVQAATGPVLYKMFVKLAALWNWTQGFGAGLGGRFTKGDDNATS